MRQEDALFLREYLKESPDFRGLVRLRPPQALWEGRWRRILEARPTPFGALLELSGGKRLRLRTSGARLGAREPGRELILDLLRGRFPGFRVEKVLTGTDRVRRQTASILRVLLSRGSRVVAVLAAYPDSPIDSERIFSSLALWWEELRRRRPHRAVLLVPEEWNDAWVRRLAHLRIPVLGFRYGAGRASLRQIYPAPPERLGVRSPYALFPPPRGAPSPLAEMVRDDGDLDLARRFGSWEVSCRGLPVAWRTDRDGQCLYDWRNPKPLDAVSKPRFDLHVAAVKRMRRFPSPDPGHPHFHLKPERWLESLLLRSHRLIDADFIDQAYCQVPTCVDGQRKVLDLLTATISGQLAVVELKVEKSLDLVFQALDYWERVEEHLLEGDFQRLGYFDGVDLEVKTPLLYLVAPLFEFHPSLPALRKSLRRPVRFRCVGLNADWRRGLRVLRRFEF